MSILQRAFDAARRVATPAPRMVAPTPTPAPRITTPIPTVTPPTPMQRIVAPVQRFVGDVGQGMATPGGRLDPVRAGFTIGLPAATGTIMGPKGTLGGVAVGALMEARNIISPPPPALSFEGVPGQVAFRQETPPPSQPASAVPEARRVTPVPPAPTLPGDFQTRLATLPPAPTLAPGAFQGQAPAQVPATRAPIITPAAAPAPAMTPPAPFMMGGGGDRDAIMGGGINVPTETPLPPARVLPSDLGTEAPMGQFDAMIRALQAGQGIPTRYVPMPAVGVSPFGPAGAQERALRRLREREFMPV